MSNDQLYLLKKDFQDQGKPYYCPGCAEMLGLLEFYPELKEHIDIHYVEFPRPRPELALLLGEDHQGCPALVLANPPVDLPKHLKIQTANGHNFVADARAIGEYLAHVHHVGLPH